MDEPIIRFHSKDGSYHGGIPARDLTAAEYDALTPEQRAVVRKSALYGYQAYYDATHAPKPEPAPIKPVAKVDAPKKSHHKQAAPAAQ